jgi:hypothetical protein
MSAVAASTTRPVLLVVAACALTWLGPTAIASGQSSTRAGDPLFGDGCRYVVVDTGTPVQPSVTVCRPFAS